MPTLIAIGLLCLAVQGCVSTRFISQPPALSDPDRTLVAECLGPVRLPKGALTQRHVERLWIMDRKALIECGRRHKALRDFYAERDAALRGAGVAK
ncbi:dehydrogenase [Mesorhizobium sp. ESP-6-4]|uniref:dehydrogenase n=1 Tax=Mesorhizobium sp. ESP-6-4 TaxID=2876624 RepID=UPI001CCFCA9A|nr:dehydrogenase [Mesorhizobium sp. ESP-6-4]MBZ9659757.1 dehydrogenase [Mesorhizobium sp. ESP-6-4]